MLAKHAVPTVDLNRERPSWEEFYKMRVAEYGGSGMVNRADLLSGQWKSVSLKTCKQLCDGTHRSRVRLRYVRFSQKTPVFHIPDVIRVEWELMGWDTVFTWGDDSNRRA